jgi:hypothetical protein
MRNLKTYELFRQWTPSELMSKVSLVFSILKTEHGWNFRTLKDDIHKKSWICLVNEKPIEIKLSEHFSNLTYSNYLELRFLDLDIPKEYYSDIVDMLSGKIKSLLEHHSKRMKCIAISIDNIDSEEISDDINTILLFIQDYLDNL